MNLYHKDVYKQKGRKAMKDYRITVCSMVDGIPAHTIIELWDDEEYAVHDFPSLQMAEDFTFILDGLGYTRIY